MLHHPESAALIVRGVASGGWKAVDKRARAADEVDFEKPEAGKVRSIGDDLGKVRFYCCLLRSYKSFA